MTPVPSGRRRTGRAFLAGALLVAGLVQPLTAGAQTATPSYVASPSSLSFTAIAGGAAPPAQTISLTGLNGAANGWNSSSTQTWLRWSPGVGTTPSTVTVSVVTSGLAAGSYDGILTFGAKGYVRLDMPVKLTLTAPSPELVSNGEFSSGTSPWVLSGGVARDTSFPLGGGGGDLLFSGTGTAYQDLAIPSTAQAADLEYFLRIDTAETSTTTAYDTLKVEVRNTGGGLLGTLASYSNLDPFRNANNYARKYGMSLLAYKGQTVRLQFSALNSPTLTTSFRIDGVSVTTNYKAPTINATPTSLSFSGYAGDANPASQSLTIENLGSGSVSWSASDDQSWLSVTPNGTTPSNATVSVNTTGLAVGKYSGTITVTASGAGNSPLVTVSLAVNPLPAGPELITNGTYSNGTTGWIRVGQAFYTTQGSHAPSGTGYMYLGTTNLANGQLYQTFSIPSTATTANLSFWMSIQTQEPSTAGPYDKLFVEVTNTSGTVLATLATFSNPSVTVTSWAAKQYYSLLAFKGQTVRLQFRVATDGSNYTTFAIDDVSVK